MNLKLRPLTAEAFAPFGQALSWKSGDQLRNNFAAKLFSGRQAAKPNLRIQRTDNVMLPLPITMIERHPQSSQMFAPLSGAPFLVIVFPSDSAGKPMLESGAAFHARGDQAVNYNRGTWHHGFMAFQRPGTFLMLRWEDGSAEDTEFLPLGEKITVQD
jgi:ureidoglycolate lyase